MHRRTFLSLGAPLALASPAGCAPPPASAPASLRAAPHPDLEEATVSDLSARLSRGELTSRSLVEAYIARIDSVDRAGPALRSVLELNPDALAIADRLDDERRARGPRGLLHGIPVLVKDNLDTGDRMQTTAGSLALLGSPAARDATVVERLRAAGAVVLGKTNLSEWANIRSTHSTSGWSARGGLTRNPYCLDRNASGSSSGSAAAVSANLAAVAIGTETDGSIVSPAAICGIVGLKPTVGLVSRAGIVPISHTQDTAGPMTRTVADAAIVLGAIAGADARDPTTARARAERDYTKFLDPNGARGARIGVVRSGFHDVIPQVQAVFDGAVEELRRLGAVVVPVEMPHGKELDDPELEVLLFELKADMASYLATRSVRDLRTLDDLVRFNTAHPDELRWFGQELFEKAVQKGGLDSPAYRTAHDTCRRLSQSEGIDAALAADKLDALVAPTGGPAWLTDFLNGDAFTGGSSTLAAVAGYPSITVPCGAVCGLPVGMSFFAGPYAEPTLLGIAFAYEQAAKHRKAPGYPATMVVA